MRRVFHAITKWLPLQLELPVARDHDFLTGSRAELDPFIRRSELQPAFEAIHAAVNDDRRPASRPSEQLSDLQRRHRLRCTPIVLVVALCRDMNLTGSPHDFRRRLRRRFLRGNDADCGDAERGKEYDEVFRARHRSLAFGCGTASGLFVAHLNSAKITFVGSEPGLGWKVGSASYQHSTSPSLAFGSQDSRVAQRREGTKSSVFISRRRSPPFASFHLRGVSGYPTNLSNEIRTVTAVG